MGPGPAGSVRLGGPLLAVQGPRAARGLAMGYAALGVRGLPEEGPGASRRDASVPFAEEVLSVSPAGALQAALPGGVSVSARLERSRLLGKLRREDRTTQGLCVTCGARAAPGRVRCIRHLVQQRDMDHRRRAHVGFRTLRRCTVCGGGGHYRPRCPRRAS